MYYLARLEKEEAGHGGQRRPATTNGQTNYRRRLPLSRKIPPRPANRHARNGRDRMALCLLSLAGNLQESAHLSRRDRRTGWAVFAVLLSRLLEVLRG